MVAIHLDPSILARPGLARQVILAMEILVSDHNQALVMIFLAAMVLLL